MEYKPEVVEPDDPTRCQAIDNATGNQCNYRSVKSEEGKYGSYCMRHGGHKYLAKERKESLRNYHLTKWQGRILQKADSPDIKSIRDEIGILRMMLETKLNACNDETDLMLHTHSISDMILKIEKLVASCHKLETHLGQTLDKSAVLTFASKLIYIITEVITDETLVEELSTRIMRELGEIGEE